MDILLICCTLFIGVALISLVILYALYDIEVEGKTFSEMSGSQKIELLMKSPKKYFKAKKMFDLYRVLY